MLPSCVVCSVGILLVLGTHNLVAQELMEATTLPLQAPESTLVHGFLDDFPITVASTVVDCCLNRTGIWFSSWIVCLFN